MSYTNPPRFLVFSQVKCVLRLAFNVTVNFNEMRPTAPGFRIFFGGKCASQKPFQIPCVFSSETRLGFNVIVNLHVMRPTASTFLVFFHRKCASQESCRIPWVHFPCVFSSKMSLGFASDCEFTCGAANRSGTPITFFQGKRASQEDSSRSLTAIANVHSCPRQEEGKMLTKEHCKERRCSVI